MGFQKIEGLEYDAETDSNSQSLFHIAVVPIVAIAPSARECNSPEY